MDKMKVLRNKIIERIVNIERGVPRSFLEPDQYYAVLQLDWVLDTIEELST